MSTYDAVRYSVVIPVFNCSEFITDCLESIIGSAPDELECIVIDDGSVDETPEKIAELAQKHPGTVRYIRQENSGVSNARNRGIRAAQGEWILFVDSDDLFLPDWQQTVFEALELESGRDVVIFSSNCSDAQMSKLECLSSCLLPTGKDGNRLGTVLRAPWSKAYSRKFIQENDLSFIPTLNMGEDALFNASVYSKNASVAFWPKSIYLYRKRIGSSTHTRSSQQLEDEILYHRSLEHILGTSPLQASLCKDIIEVNCLGGLLNILRKCKHSTRSIEQLRATSDWGKYSQALDSLANHQCHFSFYQRAVLTLLRLRTLRLACTIVSFAESARSILYKRSRSVSIERI